MSSGSNEEDKRPTKQETSSIDKIKAQDSRESIISETEHLSKLDNGVKLAVGGVPEFERKPSKLLKDKGHPHIRLPSSPSPLENKTVTQMKREQMIKSLKAKIYHKNEDDIKKEELMKLNNYLVKIPPDFNSAMQHGKAMQMRASIREMEADDDTKCICCKRLLPEYTRQIGL